MISNNYVSILVIYYLFIDYDIFRSYSQHSMVEFIKEKSVSIYNEHQDNTDNNYIIIYGKLQQFIP